MTMSGVVLDPETGLPRVVPVRTKDGNLVFAYETRRAGGMSVLVDVPSDALSNRRTDEADARVLHGDLAKAAKAVAGKIARGEERPGEVETYGVGSTPTDPEREKELQEFEEAKRVADAAAARVDEAEELIADKDIEAQALRERIAELEAADERRAREAARKRAARTKATA